MVCARALARALHNTLRLPLATVHQALEAVGHDHRARAEALSVAKWVELAIALDSALMSGRQGS